MPAWLKKLGLSWSQIKSLLETEGAKNKAYDSDVDGVFDLEAIPTITRDKLEYPTEDVSFAYLQAIGKVYSYPDEGHMAGSLLFGTVDSFADKSVEVFITGEIGYVYARWSDDDNFYRTYQETGLSTADHKLHKFVGGTNTELGSESVDLNDYYMYRYKLSCNGSAIKSFRVDMTTPKISVTDTDLASGKYGIFSPNSDAYPSLYGSIYLRAPSTKLPQLKAIVEFDIIGSGTEEDPIRPNLKQLFDQHPELDKQIDKTAVTWGAFDPKPEHNTMLITITAGNPYTGEKAITEQIEHAKSKNLKVLKPPRDYSEVTEQYRQLKQEFTEWIAGKDNYAYQTLGHEDFEKFQVADTYYGNIVEGYKPDAYKNVPDWEMRKTLAMWKERLKRATVVKSEAEKHLKKLEEVEKNGW